MAVKSIECSFKEFNTDTPKEDSIYNVKKNNYFRGKQLLKDYAMEAITKI